MKFFALCLFALIPFLFSLWKVEELKEKMKLQEALLIFLEEICFQIKHFNRDQKEIFCLFQNKVLEKSAFLNELRKETEEKPLFAVKRTLEKHLPSFSFSEKCQDALLKFAENFGVQSKQRQLEELEETIEILSAEQTKEKPKTENKMKMIRTTGITAALGILILLI